MSRYFLSLVLLIDLANASLLDFNYLNQAKEAYNDKNYSKAQKFYNKIQGDEANFNVADSLYRQKKYKEAIEAYKSISDEKLKFKSLHNIGNSYAQMNKLDEGIKAYEKALEIKDDSDTKFNLELLKKKKKEQDKKDKNDKNKDKNKENKDKEKNNKNDKKKNEQDKEKKNDSKEDKEKTKNEKKNKDQMKAPKKQPPISNMEERKWQKMLNKRGVKTLMIPLPTKGEKRNETNPW